MDAPGPVGAPAGNTFEALLELGVIPVVNENDSVSSAEIETGKCKVLGDNDTLSAIVARLCRADLLVLLSDIDGLYDDDPHATPAPGSSTGWRPSHRSCGPWPAGRVLARHRGMATKLSAAELAMGAGVDMVITNGARPEDLYGVVNGEDGDPLCRKAPLLRPVLKKAPDSDGS